MESMRSLAVVTGASSGIGLELAKILAEAGFDLLASVEEDDSELTPLRRHGVSVDVVPCDLSTSAGVDRLCDAVTADGRPVSVLALNAGAGLGGAFLESDMAGQARVIDLNVSSTVRLARRLLPGMVARDEGRVLVTSSVAATMPGSYQAVYNASKSFLQSFSQALAEELKGSRVTVTALMPGPTETDFFRRAGMQETTPLGRQPKDDARQVARQGYEAMMAGKTKVLAGSAKTRAQGVANKVMPDRLKAAVHRRMAEPDAEVPVAGGSEETAGSSRRGVSK
jgi:short-subunit dehydrogenase